MADRIVGVLTARLEELASAAERCGAGADAVARLLEAASVATVRAAALEARRTRVAGETRRPAVEHLREAA
jgi:hypothetical protein